MAITVIGAGLAGCEAAWAAAQAGEAVTLFLFLFEVTFFQRVDKVVFLW